MRRAGLGFGLGLTVDIQIGTIMTINEDPSPNLIGRQVDRSTSRQVDNSVLAVQINDRIDVQPHIHWKLKRLSHVDVARQSYLVGFFL